MYSISDGLSTGRVNPTIGPPPPNVVAEVPLPLDPNGELVDEPVPVPGADCPNADDVPLCPKLEPDEPRLDPLDPKLEPLDPKLEPLEPKLDPLDPKLDPVDPNPEFADPEAPFAPPV